MSNTLLLNQKIYRVRVRLQYAQGNVTPIVDDEYVPAERYGTDMVHSKADAVDVVARRVNQRGYRVVDGQYDVVEGVFAASSELDELREQLAEAQRELSAAWVQLGENDGEDVSDGVVRLARECEKWEDEAGRLARENERLRAERLDFDKRARWRAYAIGALAGVEAESEEYRAQAAAEAATRITALEDKWFGKLGEGDSDGP